MELLPLILVALTLAVAAGILMTMLVRRRRSERSAACDDTRRVGDAPDPTRGAAASRAEGEAAWMRPSGM